MHVFPSGDRPCGHTDRSKDLISTILEWNTTNTPNTDLPRNPLPLATWTKGTVPPTAWTAMTTTP